MAAVVIRICYVPGYYGQLGHGDREDRSMPTHVAAMSSVKPRPKTICCGAWSTFVIIAK